MVFWGGKAPVTDANLWITCLSGNRTNPRAICKSMGRIAQSSHSPTRCPQASTLRAWFSICKIWVANLLTWHSSIAKCSQLKQVHRELQTQDPKSVALRMLSTLATRTTPNSSTRLAQSNFNITTGRHLPNTRTCQRTPRLTTFSVMEVRMRLFFHIRILSQTPKRSITRSKDWMKAPAKMLIRKTCLFRGVDNTRARKRRSAHVENLTRSNHSSRATKWQDLEQHLNSWTPCSVKTKIRTLSRSVLFLLSTKSTRISWISSTRVINSSRSRRTRRSSSDKVLSCCRTV